MKDSVDVNLEKSSAKKIRLCEKGHENVVLRKNKKFCSSQKCKALLTLKTPEEEERCQSAPLPENTISPDEQRSIYYMKLPNIHSEKMEEIPMGAIPINPNNKSRVRKCLDDILSKCNMSGKYSVKLCIEGKNIKKELIQTDEDRTWILLSCDGLPFRHIISIIQENHTCIDCGKNVLTSEILVKQEHAGFVARVRADAT